MDFVSEEGFIVCLLVGKGQNTLSPLVDGTLLPRTRARISSRNTAGLCRLGRLCAAEVGKTRIN